MRRGEAWLGVQRAVAIVPGEAETFSAFRTDAANVIIDTLKPAEDGSGDLILRLYESKKADTYFHVLSGLPVKTIQRCDLLENPVGELEEADAALHVRPFEVLTLRVKL